MRLTSTPWDISKRKGKINPPALPEASMPALRNEEEATKPTVETEDRNQAHSEVTKDSTTAQPAPVTERLSEEVERNGTMLIDAPQPSIDHMNTFGGAFHSTSVRNTDSLIKNGVCQSNELSYAGRGRLSVHFGVFAS